MLLELEHLKTALPQYLVQGMRAERVQMRHFERIMGVQVRNLEDKLSISSKEKLAQVFK